MPRRGGKLAAALASVALLGALVLPEAVRAAPPEYLPGIDVSHWQNTIDWAKVAGDGVKFAIHKATEGQTYKDPTYVTNRQGAGANGIKFTAYHFARPDNTANDPVIEADHFVDTAQLQAGNLIPALDLEAAGGLGVTALQDWVLAWLGRVYQRLGVKAMIYTSPSFWRNRMGDTRAFADAGYKVLWIAHWFVNAPTVPANNWGGHSWTFWQWTDCWSVSGIQGCVDGDRYNGTDLGKVTMRTLAVTRSASGRVTTSPTGINCGRRCERLFDPGASVSLAATPAAGATFLGWGGACSGTGGCSVTMNANRSVTASFGFTLSASRSGTGKGRVTSSASGIDCGSSCQAAYVSGTSVSLTATPEPGSVFGGWSGACSGTGSCGLVMDANKAATATFVDVAPKASIAPPSGLLGTARATFNEDVEHVSVANFVIRVKGSTANLAGTLSCTDGGGGPVDCGSGPVRVARFQPASPLIPGQRYRILLNPSGASPLIADPEGNALARTSRAFRGARTAQESSPWAGYAWGRVSASGAYGGSYTREHLAGARASYDFAGSSITWYTVRGPNHGLANVYIDGVLQGTFDQYASGLRYRVPRTFTGLGPGAHTIEIAVRGRKASASSGTYVAVDAFEVDGIVVGSPKPEYSWRSVSSSAASGGRYAVSGVRGAVVTLRFRGTAVNWYTVTGPGQGKAAVYVDGNYKMTVDNYSANATYGVRRRIANLTDALHTLKIRVLGQKRSASRGYAVIIDRWVVE